MTFVRRSLFELLDCEIRGLLRKRVLWLWGAWYLAIVLAVFYPAMIYAGRQTAFGMLRILNVMTAIAIPMFGACRMVDDVGSGTLMLMKVAAVPATEWIAFRLLSIAVGYLTVWIVRLPVYSLILFTGTATLEDLLWAEAVTTCLMIGCSQMALLVARHSQTEPAAIGASFGLLFAINAAFFVPIFVVLLLRHVGGFAISPLVQDLAEFSRDSSLLMHLFSRPATPEGQFRAAVAMGIPIVLGLFASFWLRRVLFIQSEPDGLRDARLAKKNKSAMSRPSRRVWDDAFAWQAAVFHCPSRPKTRAFVWAVITLVVVASLLVPSRLGVTERSTGFGIMLIFAICAAESIPSICVAQELKQNTLSSLATLPGGATGIYRGWLRGKRRLRTENWVGGGLIMAAMIWIDPVRGMLWALAGVAAAYALPPVLFVQSLEAHERSWRSGIRGGLMGCTSLLVRPLGALPIIYLGAVAALLFRPRAVRQMDDKFLAASSR